MVFLCCLLYIHSKFGVNGTKSLKLRHR